VTENKKNVSWRDPAGCSAIREFTGSEQLRDDGNFKEAVVAYIKERDYVSLVELEQFLTPKFDTKGERNWISTKCSNIILWSGVNDAFLDLLDQLIDEKRVFLHPADFLTYVIDGGGLNLPLVKKAYAYKKPHWLPTCLRVVPR